MTPSERIERLIAGIQDWRGKTFAHMRKAILAADPDIVEEWKWMGSPVWSCDGMIAVANAHKSKVKLTFMHGAKIDDPDGLFNADSTATPAARSTGARATGSMRTLKAPVREAITFNRTGLRNAGKGMRKGRTAADR